VLLRSERDPDGPIEARQIEACFVRHWEIIQIQVAGRIYGTTSEHPFYVSGKGWTKAIDLSPGDLLVGHTQKLTALESIHSLGESQRVYNFRVQEHATYFVGKSTDDWSLWVHNSYEVKKADDGLFYVWGRDAMTGAPKKVEGMQGYKKVEDAQAFADNFNKVAQTRANDIANAGRNVDAIQDSTHTVIVENVSAPSKTVLDNAADGAAREARVHGKLSEHFTEASVQRERYLRTADGKRAIDPLTEEARRIDHAVIENGRVRYLVETTSKTADKTAQLAKEARIRANGGTFIRDKVTRELIDVSNVLTRLTRRK
jgi:hypothetical protein